MDTDKARRIKIIKSTEEDKVYFVVAGNGQELGFVEFWRGRWDARCPRGYLFDDTKLKKDAVEEVVANYVWHDTKSKYLTLGEFRWSQIIESIKDLNAGMIQKPAPIYTDEMTDEELANLMKERLGR